MSAPLAACSLSWFGPTRGTAFAAQRAARVAVAWVVAAVVAFGPLAASAATFTVDNFADLNDSNAGNGVCDVGNGSCSFRAAVQEANALAGRDTLMLAAGTHVISQLNGFPSGIPVSLNSEIDVVGQGIGVTTIYSQQSNFLSNAIVEVYALAGRTTFSELTIDVRTGGYGVLYSGQCATCGMTLDTVELLGNVTVPTPPSTAPHLLFLGNQGGVTLRNVTIGHGRPGAFTTIGSGISGELLVEDSLMDGFGVSNTFIAHTTPSPTGRVTLRRTTVRNLANAFSLSAALQVRNYQGPGQPVTIEDCEFVAVARGLLIDTFGNTQGFSVTGSLFAATAAAVTVSGPSVGAIRNSTISGGTTGVALIAPSNSSGIAALELNNTTITGATTSISNPAVNGSVSARNSIVANGSTACSAPLQSLGHNLIEGPCTITGDTTGNILATDPQLAALADNGGPTRSHALQAGSPAVDTAHATSCEALDQRGYTRPADGDGNSSAVCDMGAFEKDALLSTNQPPDAVADDVTMAEDASILIDVAGNDTDADANLDPSSVNATCSGCTSPLHGDLTAQGNGSFLYQADPDYFGADAFIYEICDSEDACDSATVSITLTPVNDAPSFLPGPSQVFPGGSSGLRTISGWASGVTFGPGETGQTVLGYDIETIDDSAGVVLGAPSINAVGDLTFELAGNAGLAEFAVRLQDDGGTAQGGSDTSPALPLFVSVGASADVSVGMQQCSPRAAPGEDYRYAFAVGNRGVDAALDLVLESALPAGASVLSLGHPDCAEQAGSIVCHVTTLAVGAGLAVPVVVQMPNVAATQLVVLASVAAATTDPVPGNNAAEIDIAITPGLILSESFESCDGLVD